MNTQTKLSASRLIVMTLACLMAVCLTACGGDDEDSGNSYEKKILGTWVYEKQSYWFNSDGKGIYKSGGDVWGDFKYNLSGRSVYMRITYVSSMYGSVWRDEESGSYNSDDDTLWIGGRRFTRKK